MAVAAATAAGPTDPMAGVLVIAALALFILAVSARRPPVPPDPPPARPPARRPSPPRAPALPPPPRARFAQPWPVAQMRPQGRPARASPSRRRVPDDDPLPWPVPERPDDPQMPIVPLGGAAELPADLPPTAGLTGGGHDGDGGGGGASGSWDNQDARPDA